jgi:hypothetical protein
MVQIVTPKEINHLKNQAVSLREERESGNDGGCQKLISQANKQKISFHN